MASKGMIESACRKLITDHFVNGKYEKAFSSEQFTALNPATNDPIASFSVGNAADIHRAIAAADRAFYCGPWHKKMSPIERASILKKFAALIRENAKFLGTVEALNVGKLHKACMDHEVHRAAANLEFFADLIHGDVHHDEVLRQRAKFLGQEGMSDSRVYNDPAGVAGIIVPWNSPLMLGTWNVAPALATGNTVVLKPPVWAPLSLLQLGKLANEAGIPPGVLNIVPGDKEAGEILVAHKDVRRISFTGSVEVGKEIQIANAKARFAPILLELGGKAANIVFSDVEDIDHVVAGVANATFRSSGQSCVATSRLLLQGSIYDRFMERLIGFMKIQHIGDHMDPSTDIGPLITHEHSRRVLKYVEIGKSEGALLRLGGRGITEGTPAVGNYFEPTIFEGVTPQMRIFQEEIFGPVLSVTSFRDTDEAIDLANSTKFGLSTNIWSGNSEFAMDVARQIDAGMIWINCHFVRDLRTPFGGVKESGVGHSGGRWSLDFFTEPKMVCGFNG